MPQTKTNTALSSLYKASAKKPAFLNIPAIKFLMIDGMGDPNISKEFQDGVQALYSLAYTIKFGRKKRGEDSDYKIPPLEGLWWADDPRSFITGDKKNWHWRLMLGEPDYISQRDLNTAKKEAMAKKKLSAVASVRLEKFSEGPAVQMMHVGPYAEEHTSIERLHNFALDSGYEITGRFHEIYMGNPRRSAPEKLKTIIRQPVKKNGKV